MKKIFLNLFVIFTLVFIMAIDVSAEKTVTVGWCGDNVVWSFDSETSILTVSGTGDMFDYINEPAPWRSIRLSIKEVQIEDGVTSIGKDAFFDCTNLVNVKISNNVTDIGENAFRLCEKLASIEIPDSAKNIGNGAFYGCDELASIKIGTGVANIGEQVFDYCYKLNNISVKETNQYYSSDTFGVLFNKEKTVLIKYPVGSFITEYTIPDSVTYIVKRAFADCCYLSSIEILDGLSNISDSAFERCTSLESIKISNSVENIGDNAFSACKNLLSIKIPDSVTSIGYQAFDNCDKLTNIEIGSSVASIANSAFTHCDNLTSVKFSDSVISIGDSAFSMCYNLASVQFGNSVTIIGDRAFSYCQKITSLEISDSMVSIGEKAFYSCDELASIKIGRGVTNIGEQAFGYCWKLKSISVDENNKIYSSDKDGVLLNKDKTVIIQYPTGNNRTKYTISNGVTSIGDYAFAYAGKLKSVEISDSVTAIGERAFTVSGIDSVVIPAKVKSIGSCVFSGCNYLKNISVSGDNPNYSNDEYGVLFNKDKTLLLQYPKGNSRTEYLIPDSVVSIDDGSFSECYNLQSVEIGDNVTNIGNSAFSLCYNLVNVKIGDSVVSIGESAFNSCEKIISLEIPDSVMNIGDRAFYDCEGLSSVKLGNGVVSIGEWAFCNCVSLTCIEIPDSVTNISDGAFDRCDSLEKITIYNPICFIADSFSTIARGATIYGYVNSTAHIYAENCHNKFVALVCLHEDVTFFNAVSATCIDSGITAGTYCNLCKTWLAERENIPAFGHNYVEGVCVNCGDSKVEDCSCSCHKDGIAKFFFKIILFFQKLFGKNQICACGVQH